MPSRIRVISFLLVLSTSLLAACGGGEQRQVIQNKGSDTLVNVAQAWAEAYQTVNPAVVVAVSGGGSGLGAATAQMLVTRGAHVVIADLDLEVIREVRDGWQFFRDRRPEMYTEICQQLP